MGSWDILGLCAAWVLPWGLAKPLVQAMGLQGWPLKFRIEAFQFEGLAAVLFLKCSSR